MGLLDALGFKPKSPSPGAPPTGVTSGAGPVKAKGSGSGPPPEQFVFMASRAGALGLINGLKAHAQKAAIQAQINQAVAKLADADAHAAKGEWPQAMQAIEDIKALFVAAKKIADDRTVYLAKRANVVAEIMALQGVVGNTTLGALVTALNNADAFAAASPPNLTAAIAALDALDTPIRNGRKAGINALKTMLANIAATGPKVQAFAAAEITKGKALLANAEAAFAASQWSQCIMATFAAIDVLAPTERMATRRAAYETARTPVVAAIASVKAVPAIKDRATALEAQLAQADAAASHDSMQFESGTATLTDVGVRCSDWLAIAGSIDTYTKQRPLADAELAALDKHSAAAKITEAREAARKLLKEAANFVSVAATASKPGPGWTSALTTLLRVRTDLAAAKALADGLGPAVAAQAAAAKPGDVAAMKTALKALQADAATAGAAPFASEAAAEFKAFKEQADKADKALAKDDGKSAAKPMAQAAQALADAKAIQNEHAEYASTLTTVEAELKKLQALPRAALLKGKIDPVIKALAEAKAKDKAHAGAEAMAALRRAADAGTAAEAADVERGKFDTSAATTTANVAAIADPKVKKTLEQVLADAKKLADAFRFDDAAAALKRTEVRIDEASLKAAASANPGDPAIATLAAKMVANGGAKDVDALVQDGKTTDPRMIAALAKGRYGVDFAFDTAAAGPREAKTMKALCGTFSKVPQDVKAHGSIKSISHADASDKNAVGGAYSSDATISLTGRPDVNTQKFGADLTRKDASGKTVKQLPKIDPECQAAGGEAELLSFTALHEVGHGVDDANTYMARNGHREDHGGWVDYGSSIQPIADAIGAHIAAKIGGATTFYKKPEDRQYVLAKILNQPAVRPAAAAGSDDAKALAAFDQWYTLATSPGVYERQPDCEAITIGSKLIYHEAYPRNWISYLAAARAKGLTGYQFRAPGEWFAELYAGFRTNKLGPKHPAREWLKKL